MFYKIVIRMFHVFIAVFILTLSGCINFRMGTAEEARQTAYKIQAQLIHQECHKSQTMLQVNDCLGQNQLPPYDEYKKMLGELD